MITDRDITKLKTVFATRKSLRAMENRIINKFNLVINHFDNKFIDHDKRISTLKTHRASL